MPFFSSPAKTTFSPRICKWSPSLLDCMEEVQRSRRRRVHSFEPAKSIVYASFFNNYVSHLLPALAEAATQYSGTGSCGAIKDAKFEQMRVVRFEVSMALVLSAGVFKWSQALRSKLEQGIMSTNKLHRSSKRRPTTANMSLIARKSVCTVQELYPFPPSLYIPRDLVPMELTRPRKIRSRRRNYNEKIEEEFYQGVSILRRILPGGNEMDVFELFSEVESYVVCLQLQVNILRSLVEAH